MNNWIRSVLLPALAALVLGALLVGGCTGTDGTAPPAPTNGNAYIPGGPAGRLSVTESTTVLPATEWTTPPTLSPSPSAVELQARLDTAFAAGNARLASKQAAYRAWAIPSRPDLVAIATNVKSNGISVALKGDGVTDDTAALNALLTKLPVGATLYFPPSTYRINGPVRITKPVTLFGETGTVFDCSSTTTNPFIINTAGSASSKMNGFTVTGITVEGPGIETNPQMFMGYFLQNVHFSYVKFHNVGYAAIALYTSTDVIVENCVFDNVFYTGCGYGVCICDLSDRVLVRNSYFVTKGRHGVTTGTGHSATIQPWEYPRAVTVDNNYFEYMTDAAVDGHSWNNGPYTVTNNVMNNCRVDVAIHNGTSVVTDNVFMNNPYLSVYLPNENVDPTNILAKTDRVERNTFINISRAIEIENSNAIIQDNFARGTTTREGVLLWGTGNPQTVVRGNILESFTRPLYQQVTNPNLSNIENLIKVSGTWQYLKI